MKKRFGAMITAMVMAASLAGCSGSQSATQTTEAKTEAAKTEAAATEAAGGDSAESTEDYSWPTKTLQLINIHSHFLCQILMRMQDGQLSI